jgi:hypothetical protein
MSKMKICGQTGRMWEAFYTVREDKKDVSTTTGVIADKQTMKTALISVKGSQTATLTSCIHILLLKSVLSTSP